MPPSDISPRLHRTCGLPPEKTCWRMAAIYRVCLRTDVTRAWVLRRIREVFPAGTRDYMADIWMSHAKLLRMTRNEKMQDTTVSRAA